MGNRQDAVVCSWRSGFPGPARNLWSSGLFGDEEDSRVGIRAALGANPRELMRLVFSYGVRPVIAGTLAGAIFALLFSFILVNALRRAPLPLNPTSPVSYGLVCASLIVSALVAMIGHARRAARIQPLVALREE